MFSRRILTKMEGVTAVVTSVEEKSVVVTVDDGKATKEAMLEALVKWGTAAKKTVELDESP